MKTDITAHIARREEILARIRKILIDNLDIRREPDEIDPDTPLFGSGLGLDSVDAVELMVSLHSEFMVSLHSEFKVALPDDASGRTAMRTVNTLVDLVIRHQENKDAH